MLIETTSLSYPHLVNWKDTQDTRDTCVWRHCHTLQHTAPHCNTLQHTAPHCTTLPCPLTCKLLQLNIATRCIILQYTATHCNTLQHTAAHCNTLQQTYVSSDAKALAPFDTCVWRHMCDVSHKTIRIPRDNVSQSFVQKSPTKEIIFCKGDLC